VRECRPCILTTPYRLLCKVYNCQDFADLVPDGRIGSQTLAALDSFLAVRGERGGERVLLHALEALQGERYVRLAERRPANEAFLYGWLANRIGTR
jgi:lysozyme family protein